MRDGTPWVKSPFLVMVTTLSGHEGPTQSWSLAFYICWCTLRIRASESNGEAQSLFSVRHGDLNLGALLLGTSALKAELKALTQALILAKGPYLTSPLTTDMPLLWFMYMGPYTKRGDYWLLKETISKIKKKYLLYWRHYGFLSKWPYFIAPGIRKGYQK